MPKFLIERDIPGAGNLTPVVLKKMAKKSVSVLAEMGPKIQWVHSYVTDNKIYSVYIAPDEALIHVHAKMASLPIRSVTRIVSTLDPTTAE